MYTLIKPGYTPLEYIESPGNAYINTLCANSNKATVDCKFVIGTPNNNYIFGSRQNSSSWMYNGLYSNNTLEYNWATGLSFTASNTIEMTQSVGGPYTSIDVNGTLKNTSTGTTADTNNIFIFACNNSSVRYYTGKTKCYYFKIKKDNVLVRDFIPCKRDSDSISGLYDLIENKFYASSGASNFTAGPEKQITDDIILDDYILFSDYNCKSVGFEKNNYVYSNDSSYYWGSPGTVTVGSSIYVQSISSSSGHGAKAVSSSPIDLTNVSTIYFNINQFYGDGIHSCTIIKNKNDYSNGDTGPVARKTFSKVGEYSIDVSSLSGDYYISFSCMSNLQVSTNTLSCNKIWTDLHNSVILEDGASISDIKLNSDCTYTILCDMETKHAPNGFYRGSSLVERNTPLLNYSVIDNSTLTLKTITSNQAVIFSIKGDS